MPWGTRCPAPLPHERRHPAAAWRAATASAHAACAAARGAIRGRHVGRHARRGPLTDAESPCLAPAPPADAARRRAPRATMACQSALFLVSRCCRRRAASFPRTPRRASALNPTTPAHRTPRRPLPSPAPRPALPRSWEKPAGYGDSAAAASGGWAAVTDPSSGKTYYYNAGTGATSWEVPAGFSAGGDVSAAARRASSRGTCARTGRAARLADAARRARRAPALCAASLSPLAPPLPHSSCRRPRPRARTRCSPSAAPSPRRRAPSRRR